MFDGVPDQFHQFIASTAAAARTTTLPLPLSFPPIHNLASSNGFTSFDPLFTSNSHHHQVSPQLQQPHFLHPLHHQHQPGQKNEEKEENTRLVTMNMEIDRERSMSDPIDNHLPWSNDEVLVLLRIRSSMDNWFPEFTWENVSRKLAELGFKRSAEKCKEKFEEESRYFNSISCSKNYRIFSELEELCQGENPPDHQHHHRQQVVAAEKNKKVEKSREDEDNIGQNLEDDPRNIDEYQTSAGNNASYQDNEKVVENKANNNKGSNKERKRQKEFEMIKGFCEDIVNKLMTRQKEMHNKLIDDMVKRDEEKVAKEEAWKKQELDRIDQELGLRAKEQAVEGDRQATIIKFLSEFSSAGSYKKQCFGRSNIEDLVKVPNEHSNPPNNSSSSLVPAAQNPNHIVNNQNKVDQVSTMIIGHQNFGSCPTRNNQIKPISMAENQAPQNPNLKIPTSSAQALAPQNPNSVNAQSNPLPPTSPFTVNKATQNPTPNDKEDFGKRWPRDEVLALINLRCTLYNNGYHDKVGSTIKAPLWERISQGMLELGYKRSAKRCKEKWENINKYFRKTKDVNKKRSLDSRTCPYFHQLSTLYNQGTLIAHPEGLENRSALPENHSDLPETGIDSSQKGAKNSSTSF
ncbi:trihelix transcription factor GTL2-like [Durio zibethinus]|uniref:Trihelix transcription factor GTL2-like n=1 Tax=Durio zibethinus TaxID=66656 RepID=A0A6P5Z1Z4_DURZI|nr:trihelix transcription factor GTL2-like [Durio zibethinus]XP_022746774.1 trihelix transcription factor GTL2-like [Durio zibethinus]